MHSSSTAKQEDAPRAAKEENSKIKFKEEDEEAKKDEKDKPQSKKGGEGDKATDATSAKEAAKAPVKTEGNDNDEEPNAKVIELTFPQQLMEAVDGETNIPPTAPNAIVTSKGERVLEWWSGDVSIKGDDNEGGEGNGTGRGSAFVIRDKALFESDVLPKYFAQRCKIMSFVRKLYR